MQYNVAYNTINPKLKTMTKKTGLGLLAAMVLLSLNSCKKDDSSSSPTTSSWTLGSTNYTAQVTINGNGTENDDADDGENFFIDASGAAGSNVASVTFKDMPTTSGTYTALADLNNSLGTSPKGCIVLMYNGTYYYSSTNNPSDKINVTVSGGKITATFSNITMQDENSSASKTASGTLVVFP